MFDCETEIRRIWDAYVEDDISFGTMLQKWFERNGFSAQWCSGMQSAQKLLSETTYDMVLSDLRLPDGDGIFVKALHLKIVR